MALPPKINFDAARVTYDGAAGTADTKGKAQAQGEVVDTRVKEGTAAPKIKQAGLDVTKTQQQIDKEAFDLAQAKLGTPLPEKDRVDLESLVDGFSRGTQLLKDFNPDYSGTILNFPTEAENRIQRKWSGFGTKGQALWWQNLHKFDMIERNHYFGASLSQGEKEAWAATSVEPGDDPDFVKQSIATRQRIVNDVLYRAKTTLLAGGFRPAQIDAAFGRYKDHFTPEGQAAFDKKLPPADQRTPADDGKTPLLDAPPEGAHLGGEGIKGWRLSQESEKAATDILRSGGTAEQYANFVADRAVEEGHIKPEERERIIAGTVPSVQEYLDKIKTPEGRAAIPGDIRYDLIDQKAQDEAGVGAKVGKAIGNLPTSAAQLAEGLTTLPVDAGLSVYEGKPVGAAKGLVDLATDSDARGAALGALGERYLTRKGLENAAITDPLGIMGDLSMVLTGGGTAGARLPGIAGKLARLTARGGELLDPITGLRKAGDYMVNGPSAVGPAGPRQRTGGFNEHIAQPIADTIGGVTREVIGPATGIPRGKPYSRAFAAGKEGGERAERFRGNMRGSGNAEALIEEADKALKQMQAEASAQYRSGMIDVSNDRTVLDFADIDQTLDDLKARAFYKGEVRNAAAAKVWTDTKALVDDWKSKTAADFHTPEGMDVLKQKIHDLNSSYIMSNDRNAAAVAMGVYHSVKKAVADQVPTYAKTMADYEKRAEQLGEIRRTFSMDPKASVDTKLRKWFSSGRNNVNANFGRREQLADTVDRYTGGKLVDDISSMNLSSNLPRGIGGALMGTLTGTGAAGGILPLFGQAATTLLNPWNLAALPLTSPRAMGEVAHFAGRASRRMGEGFDKGVDLLTPQKLLDLQSRHPTSVLAGSRVGTGLEGAAAAGGADSRPPISPEPITVEGDLGDLTPEEIELLRSERARRAGMSLEQKGFAYGGPVRRLAAKYACGGPVRYRR
jgi:hypothetical protein